MNRRSFLTTTGAALAVSPLTAFKSLAADAADSFDIVIYGGVPCGIAAAIPIS